MPTGILLPKFFLVFVVLRYPFETSVVEFCVQNSMPSYAELNTKWCRSRCQPQVWQEIRHTFLVRQEGLEILSAGSFGDTLPETGREAGGNEVFGRGKEGVWPGVARMTRAVNI